MFGFLVDSLGPWLAWWMHYHDIKLYTYKLGDKLKELRLFTVWLSYRTADFHLFTRDINLRHPPWSLW